MIIDLNNYEDCTKKCVRCSKSLEYKRFNYSEKAAEQQGIHIGYYTYDEYGYCDICKCCKAIDIKTKKGYKRSIKNICKRFDYPVSRFIELIGCSENEYRQYIESLFYDDMCWENYGKWHIDHIKPVCLFKLPDEVKKCNHYTNLQPLWSKENHQKGIKY